MNQQKICAIYTRKSTEEGLEQEFNSLDAQRESCEAYILSHRHEGWLLHPEQYNDGGISGGTMERPALQRLLNDIRQGIVDIVVVYKVDRLTRSLADFAKMVEIFDAQSASFVSVTQQFNTTDSMGRLTLNVLLSFAQFEREVTGERIRDKIAASKKKGMWMGGKPPIGYDCQKRELVINHQDAQLINMIFSLYLKHKRVSQVYHELKHQHMLTPIKVANSGIEYGGKPFSRGHLYRILSNPIYIGKVKHKEQVHDGLHNAIIDKEAWNQVQQSIQVNTHGRAKEKVNRASQHLLTGLLFDEHGERLTPTHSNKKGKRYRYYISAAVAHTCNDDKLKKTAWRIPAEDLEQAVLSHVQTLLTDTEYLVSAFNLSHLPSDALKAITKGCQHFAQQLNEVDQRHNALLDIIHNIEVASTRLNISFNTNSLFSDSFNAISQHMPSYSSSQIVSFDVAFKKRGVETKLVYNTDNQVNLDPVLIKTIIKGRTWFNELISGDISSIKAIGRRDNVCPTIVTRHIHISLLSPVIVEQCLTGKQPAQLTAQWLKKNAYKLPLDWDEQQQMIANI